MKNNLFISIVAILIGGFFASSVVADDKNHHDNLVKFKGGIGVIPISNVALDATTGAVIITRNMVRGVNSPGQIWRIKDLEAKIKDNGDIKVKGEGLLLAGGNNIGMRHRVWQPSFFVVIRRSHHPVWRLRLMATSKSRAYLALYLFQVSVKPRCSSFGA